MLLTNKYIRLLALAPFCGVHVSGFRFVGPFVFRVHSTSHGVLIRRACLFNVHCPSVFQAAAPAPAAAAAAAAAKSTRTASTPTRKTKHELRSAWQ